VSIHDADEHFKSDVGHMTFQPLTRARRREMTKRHLMDAAAVIFARDGFHGASLDDVAAAAGFTKGAVYSNFAGKEDLFLAVFEERFAQEQSEMQRALTEQEQPYSLGDETEAFSRVRGVIDRTWDDEWTALYLEFVLYAQRNEEAARKLAECVRRQREMTVGMLDDAYKAVDYMPDTPLPVFATLSIALFDGLALGRLADPGAFDEQMLTEALALLIRAIGANQPLDGE
jgi:AcrR family transcriptional regulator